MLPKGTQGTCTILYHGNGNVANMEASTIQPQRVAIKSGKDAVSNAQEPNYVSGDKDDVRPKQRRQSPRLKKYLENERPDRPGNVPHRIVALAAQETAEIPHLVIQ